MTDFSSHSTQHSVDPAGPDPDFINWLREHCVPSSRYDIWRFVVVFGCTLQLYNGRLDQDEGFH